mmetsp:Transcript_31719/g.51369  ORF Transcript_31719/g.51369 Transcript_31719/m.51369 type:complete len:552 (+) Transcript_31719:327-1982(+)
MQSNQAAVSTGEREIEPSELMTSYSFKDSDLIPEKPLSRLDVPRNRSVSRNQESYMSENTIGNDLDKSRGGTLNMGSVSTIDVPDQMMELDDPENGNDGLRTPPLQTPPNEPEDIEADLKIILSKRASVLDPSQEEEIKLLLEDMPDLIDDEETKVNQEMKAFRERNVEKAKNLQDEVKQESLKELQAMEDESLNARLKSIEIAKRLSDAARKERVSEEKDIIKMSNEYRRKSIIEAIEAANTARRERKMEHVKCDEESRNERKLNQTKVKDLYELARNERLSEIKKNGIETLKSRRNSILEAKRLYQQAVIENQAEREYIDRANAKNRSNSIEKAKKLAEIALEEIIVERKNARKAELQYKELSIKRAIDAVYTEQRRRINSPEEEKIRNRSATFICEEVNRLLEHVTTTTTTTTTTVVNNDDEDPAAESCIKSSDVPVSVKILLETSKKLPMSPRKFKYKFATGSPKSNEDEKGKITDSNNADDNLDMDSLWDDKIDTSSLPPSVCPDDIVQDRMNQYLHDDEDVPGHPTLPMPLPRVCKRGCAVFFFR